MRRTIDMLAELAADATDPAARGSCWQAFAGWRRA
jgi:hypothetical protein